MSQGPSIQYNCKSSNNEASIVLPKNDILFRADLIRTAQRKQAYEDLGSTQVLLTI